MKHEKKLEKNNTITWNVIGFYLIAVSFVVVDIYLVFTNVRYLTERFSKACILACLFAALAFFCILIITIKKCNVGKRMGILVIIALSFVIYLGWNVLAKTEPISDYEVLVDGAKQMVHGSFPSLSFDKTNYFYFYNYQIGYVLYLAGIMRLFGSSLISLKIAECLIMTASNILVYLIIDKACENDKISLFTATLYLLLPFNIMGSSVINNQHLGLLLLLGGSYCLLNNDRIVGALGAGILFALSVLVRPSGIVWSFAVLFYIFLLIIREKERRKTQIARFLGIILMMSVCISIIDFAVVKSGLAPDSISKPHASKFKYVLGLTGQSVYGFETENASHTQVYFDLKSVNFDYEKYNKDSSDYLFSLFCNEPQRILSYELDKMRYFAIGIDTQVDFSGKGTINEVVYAARIGYFIYILLLLISLWQAISYLMERKKETEDDAIQLVSFLCIVLYFCAHILIEVQPRYRFEIYVCLCFIAGKWVGSRFLTNKCN